MATQERSKISNQKRRVFNTLKSTVYLLIVPVPFLGVIPWWMSRWRQQPPLLGFASFRWIGILLMAAGVAAMMDSYAQFIFRGDGTPSPMFPTRRLVVAGLYRYVRNPMYIGAIAILLGEGLYLGDVRVLLYILFPWLMLYLFVRIDEEPTLRRSYGAEYVRYCAHVRRWRPRLTPWGEGRE
jgi:protein-S-isoprenylcysteine O-methyltransferase Ste14